MDIVYVFFPQSRCLLAPLQATWPGQNPSTTERDALALYPFFVGKLSVSHPLRCFQMPFIGSRAPLAVNEDFIKNELWIC